MNMLSRFTVLLALLIVAVFTAGCSKRSSQEPDREADVAARLASSLHGTTRGMEYWYESEQGGFEDLTGVPYDDLACKSCHVEPGACATCHATANAATAEASLAPAQSDDDCLGCHGHQGAEILNGLTDYHRDEEGLRCRDCHGADEIHGDKNTYNSMHEPGAIQAKCDNPGCHDTLASNEFHDSHAGDNPIGADMECAACHVQSVVTCYNCHFEYEVEGYGKLSHGQFTGWKLLIRRDRGDGRRAIDAGNMLTVTYQNNAFVAIAPYYAHTVSKNAVSDCGDCHNNEYVQEYRDTGSIVIASWNESMGAIVPNIKGKGIIPIPEDWRTALRFDFATFDDAGPEPPRWIHITPSEVGRQMLFAEPLEDLPE